MGTSSWIHKTYPDGRLEAEGLAVGMTTAEEVSWQRQSTRSP